MRDCRRLACLPLLFAIGQRRGAIQSGNQDDEFLPTISCGKVTGATGHLSNRVSYANQTFIAFEVTQRIVVSLKYIDIDQQRNKWRLLAQCTSPFGV